MCGLVGIVCENMFHEHKKAFKFLLWLDEKRGRHSTGVCIVNNKKEYQIAKSLGGSYSLYYDDKENKVFEKTGLVKEFNPLVLMGHNRHATVGAISAENAHPFDVKNRIIGAHNGTLIRGLSLSKLKKYKHDKVDSLVLYEELNEDDGDMKTTYSKLNGAMALTWVDIAKNTFNILKNNQRTLYVAYLKNDSGFMYASEPWMLDAVFHDYPNLFVPTETKYADFEFDVVAVPSNTWFSIDLNNIKECMKNKEQIATKVEPYKEPEYKSNFHNPHHNHAHHYTQGQYRTAVRTTGSNVSAYRGSTGGKQKNRLKVRGNKENGFFIKSKSIDYLPDPKDLYMVYGKVIDYVEITSGPQIDQGKWLPDYEKNIWILDSFSQTSNGFEEEDEEIDNEEAPLYIIFNNKLMLYSLAQAIVDKWGCGWCGSRNIDLKNKEERDNLIFNNSNEDAYFFCCKECASEAYDLTGYGGV